MRLDVEPAPPVLEAVAAPPPGGLLHRLAVGGMTVAAVVGIVTMFSMITITWTDSAQNTLNIVFGTSIVLFLVCGSIAVFTAARDTYPRSSGRP